MPIVPVSAIVGVAVGLAIIYLFGFRPSEPPTYLILVVCISVAAGVGKLIKSKLP